MHTLKLQYQNLSFGEALASHANAQAHSMKLQASAEHNHWKWEGNKSWNKDVRLLPHSDTAYQLLFFWDNIYSGAADQARYIAVFVK